MLEAQTSNLIRIPCINVFLWKRDFFFFFLVAFKKKRQKTHLISWNMVYFSSFFLNFSLNYMPCIVIWIYLGRSFLLFKKRGKQNECSELLFIYAVFVYMFALNLSLIYFINVCSHNAWNIPAVSMGHWRQAHCVLIDPFAVLMYLLSNLCRCWRENFGRV